MFILMLVPALMLATVFAVLAMVKVCFWLLIVLVLWDVVLLITDKSQILFFVSFVLFAIIASVMVYPPLIIAAVCLILALLAILAMAFGEI